MPYIVALLNTSSPAPAIDGTSGLQGSSVLSAILMLLVMAAVIVAAYFVTRFVAGGAMRMQRGSRMRVVDRLGLARDKAVVVVEIAGRYYALGVSGNAVQLLCELDEEDYAGADYAEPTGGFRAIWDRAISPPLDTQKSQRTQRAPRGMDDDELDRMAARIRQRRDQLGGKDGRDDEGQQ